MNFDEGSEQVSKALDLMVKAGWVKQYAYKLNTGFAIDWTDNGKLRIETLWMLIQELGADNLSGKLWWAVLVAARTRFET